MANTFGGDFLWNMLMLWWIMVEVMEQALNHLIDVLDNNFSLISMVIGAMLGFFSQLYLNKINQKNEITKELSKEYIRTKMDVLGKAVELFQEYELKMKTEMPTYYYDDIWDICVEENNEEIIYWCYFLKVIEYLNKNIKKFFNYAWRIRGFYSDKSIIHTL